ncbi:hypothetical protein B0H13DRAFT_975594 [Mycena leptocephala]|nr:hypothetical protein B0H13DRAFT_975594 [Mycena leptocephala]
MQRAALWVAQKRCSIRIPTALGWSQRMYNACPIANERPYTSTGPLAPRRSASLSRAPHFDFPSGNVVPLNCKTPRKSKNTVPARLQRLGAERVGAADTHRSLSSNTIPIDPDLHIFRVDSTASSCNAPQYHSTRSLSRIARSRRPPHTMTIPAGSMSTAPRTPPRSTRHGRLGGHSGSQSASPSPGTCARLTAPARRALPLIPRRHRASIGAPANAGQMTWYKHRLLVRKHLRKLHVPALSDRFMRTLCGPASDRQTRGAAQYA